MNEMDRKKLFNNMDICEEALGFLHDLMKQGKEEESCSLLCDMKQLFQSMSKNLKQEMLGGNLISHAYFYCENIIASIDRFLQFPSKRHRILKYDISASAWSLRFMLYWQYEVLRDKSSIDNYRKKIFHDLDSLYMHRKEEGNYKYKVSISLFAYNKLEYTKRAIESIMEYTDFSKGDIELVLTNNGSTDGTEEYFEGIPNAKIVNNKYNILGGVPSPNIIEGKYVVGFSNDVVATPRWLEQLLECIESSDDIAMVVPTCPEWSISNLQGIPVSYQNNFSDMGKMQKFAQKYNQSNPQLWEDRILLMPFVYIGRTDVLSKAMVDPSYTKLQFIDDDISTVLRRTGWRQVLAKDTFLHHFGSITLGDSKVVSNQNSLDEMRKVYFDKWGVDAWESRGLLGIEHTFQWISPKKGSRILWIEPKFGADFLSMKNYYRKNGCGDVKADAMVVDSRYLPDAKYSFDRCISAENLLQAVSEVQDEYDLIGMSACLHEVVDGSAVALLEKLYRILKPGGQLLVPVKNWNSASCLKEMITSGGVHPWGCPANTFKGLSMWGLLESLAQHEYLKKYSRLVVTEADKKLCKSMHSKLAKMFSDVYDSDTFETILQVNMMWLRFQKN